MSQPESKTEIENRLAAERAQRAAEARDDDPEHDDEHDEELDDELDDEHDDVEVDEAEVEGMSDEQLGKAIGKLVDAFEADLRELIGAEEELTAVPMDGAVGFMLPGALVYNTHEKFRRCSTCNGRGEVLTGSLADGKQTADCPRCGGRGYLEKLDDEPAGEEQGATNGTGAADPDAGYGVPTWMGDPNIGTKS